MRKLLSLLAAVLFCTSIMADTYQKVTTAPSSWEGEYVIAALASTGDALVWTGVDAGLCRDTVVVNDDQIDGSFVTVTVEALEAGYGVKVNGGTNDGKYISSGTSAPGYSNGIKFIAAAARVDFALNEDLTVAISQTIDKDATVDSVMYLIYNKNTGSSNERYRFYKGTNYGTANYLTPCLWKKVEITPEPEVAPALEADYYLSNPYLFINSELRDTVAHDENVKVNSVGLIKLVDDGWSDYHWDGASACVFNNINMSEAGQYKVTWNGRNSGTVDFVVNGTLAETVVSDGTYPKYVIVTLAAGMNTIAIQKNADWPGTYSIELEKYAPAQEADYYLSNPYLFINSELRDTVAHDENVKVNSVGLIKLVDNGWSDYHWDGASACVFNNINMSEAGQYKVTWNGRNSGTVDFVVNGTLAETVVSDGTYPKYVIVTLAAGMNTIAIQKNADWPGTYSIELEKYVTDPTTADYYLSNPYLFINSELRDTVAHDENVKVNSIGLIKLVDNGWSDYHWDGASACVFNNINMSQAGLYDLTWNGRNNGTVDILVNGEQQRTVTVSASDYPYVIYNLPLVAGMNTIAIQKNADWPGTYSIELALASVVKDTTIISFDANGGTLGTASVTAVKGEELDSIAIPTRSGMYFDGYWSEAEGGVQYYDNGGAGIRTWDLSDATYTLYAHWTTGAIVVPTSVTCEDGSASDYYLSHMYYALCTNWTPMADTINGVPVAHLDGGSYCLVNSDGNLFKLCSDGMYVDYHWDSYYGTSAIIYDNINVSESGNYDIKWYQRNGGSIDVIVNGDTLGTYAAGQNDTLTIYRAPLVAGTANSIKLTRNNNWPQQLGIMLEKSAAVLTTTTITLDAQGGNGGTESVVATKGYAMPEIVLPTRDGYVFEGYFTAAEGGDQYYNMDGSSFKAWDKDDATYTLYAHWNDGSTGDCPDEAVAKTENYYFTHMYDARCTQLTNTWEMDNNEYIYTNVEGENIKITQDGNWMDFYWADPSSIIFDEIYVSEDGFYDMIWYFHCDNIDGDNLDGSLTHVYVNDELFDDVVVYLSDDYDQLPMDSVIVEGLELYADGWGNKIKLLKGNGWPLTRGIKLLGNPGSALDNTSARAFTVRGTDGMLTIGSLEGTNTICIYNTAGQLVETAVTSAAEWSMALPQGAYLVEVNQKAAKAIIR